jgi:cytochrome c oxidase assembly protein subunit 15
LLAGVILQGVLGGMRVELDERMLALVHGCVGPLFFAATAAMVAVTSRRWETASPASGRVFRLALITAAVAYLQLIVGAVVRHSPLMLTERAAAIFQVAVYFHVVLAAVVVAHVVWLAWQCWREKTERGLAAGLAGLVLVQVLLGASTWLVKYGTPAWAQRFVDWNYVNTEADLVRAAVITTHGAVGALLMALGVVLALRTGRSLGAGSKERQWSAPRAAGVLA